MRKPLMLMRKKGLLGTLFGRHANSSRLSKSVGEFIGRVVYSAIHTYFDSTDNVRRATALALAADSKLGTFSAIIRPSNEYDLQQVFSAGTN